MSTSASLDPASVSVEPGGTATVILQVRNSGPTVEAYRFEAVGEDAAWISVQPAGLSLYPGTADTATVQLQPPRSSAVLAGDRPFGVRVVPTDHPDQMVVPEGMLRVLPFGELAGELTPRSSTGALRGRHRVALDNPGNAPLAVRLVGQPAGEQIRLDVVPEELEVPPGEAAFARVRAQARRRMWRGAPATHPFQVVATAATGEAVVLDGSYQQQPLLPRWLPRAVMAAVVALAALVALWFALVRPAVRSAARQAVPAAVQSALTASPQPGGGQSGSQGGGPGGGPSSSTQSGPQSGPTSGQSGPTPATGTPPPPSTRTPGPTSTGPAKAATSARLVVNDTVGGTSSSDVYQVPANQILEVTDIVVQNPQGDAGRLVISTQDRTLLVLALENFRDDPYYFSTPIVVPGGGSLTMTVTCRQVGLPVAAPKPTGCAESMLLSGSLRAAPRPATLR